MSTTLFTSGEQAGQNVTSVARHPFLIRRTKHSTLAPHLSQERLWISFTQRMFFLAGSSTPHHALSAHREQ
jgi:hypothetical protein